MTFEYSATQFKATDSLNHVVTVTYAGGSTAYDEIAYQGYGGAARTIRVFRTTLEHALQTGFSLTRLHDLFPTLNGSGSTTTNYDTDVVSGVQLPDGRQYQFRYNNYGELARVDLPTDGAMEYDHLPYKGAGPGDGGVVTASVEYAIYRRVVGRRVLDSDGTIRSKTNFSRPDDSSPALHVVWTVAACSGF